MNMYGSAHNVFAQTFAGKGAAGLLSLVGLVLAAAWAAWRTARDAGRAGDVRLVATIALGMIGAFALYGQVQEVFYIQVLQITAFAAFGVAAGLAPIAQPGTISRRAGLVTAALLIVLGAHVAHAWVQPGRLAEGYRDHEISRAGERLGAPEPDGEGGYFQWTTGAAFVTVPRQATALSFDLRSLAPGAQVVEVRLDDRLVDRIQLGDHGWHHAQYPLGKLRRFAAPSAVSVEPTWRSPAARAARGRVRRIRGNRVGGRGYSVAGSSIGLVRIGTGRRERQPQPVASRRALVVEPRAQVADDRRAPARRCGDSGAARPVRGAAAAADRTPAHRRRRSARSRHRTGSTPRRPTPDGRS